MFILSVWFLWLTAVKSIQLASVFNIFSCSPTQILSNLSMRCQTLNGHNFFPQGGINGELSRFTLQIYYTKNALSNDTKFGLLPILSGFSLNPADYTPCIHRLHCTVLSEITVGCCTAFSIHIWLFTCGVILLDLCHAKRCKQRSLSRRHWK